MISKWKIWKGFLRKGFWKSKRVRVHTNHTHTHLPSCRLRRAADKDFAAGGRCCLGCGHGWCGTAVMGLCLSSMEICRNAVVCFSMQPLSVDLCRNVPCHFQIKLKTNQFPTLGIIDVKQACTEKLNEITSRQKRRAEEKRKMRKKTRFFINFYDYITCPYIPTAGYGKEPRNLPSCRYDDNDEVSHNVRI